MLVNFDSLADTSRIWIYQSNREFKETEIAEISTKIENFVANWQRHGEDLKASFQVKYNQFIILAVDEAYNEVSGCSIDASTHLIKQIEEAYHVELFNKMNTAFKDGEHINSVVLTDFQKYASQQKITSKTIVFNNLVNTKRELETAWEIPAEKSWHSRYFG
jgi:hypothetical protein